MAAPVKNLVDATSPSKVAPTSIKLPISRKFLLSPLRNVTYSVQVETSVDRFTLVIPLNRPINSIPMFIPGIRTKEAGIAAIKTFPAIYKERVSTRPTEGQIFPRGFN